MIVRLLATLLFLFVAAAPLRASDTDERLKPWDDGPQDPSFLKFRNGLMDIIARKDAAALMKFVARDVKSSFAGDEGVTSFRRGWKPEDPNSELWPCLSLVVEMGGNFDSKTAFSAPYVFSAFPSDVDGFDKVVVIAESSVMRAEPKADATIVRPLDRDILTVLGGPPKAQHQARPGDWVEVKDAKGRHGFVPAMEVRSPIDYRALFEKRRGKWLVTSFLSGD